MLSFSLHGRRKFYCQKMRPVVRTKSTKESRKRPERLCANARKLIINFILSLSGFEEKEALDVTKAIR